MFPLERNSSPKVSTMNSSREEGERDELLYKRRMQVHRTTPSRGKDTIRAKDIISETRGRDEDKGKGRERCMPEREAV